MNNVFEAKTVKELAALIEPHLECRACPKNMRCKRIVKDCRKKIRRHLKEVVRK